MPSPSIPELFYDGALIDTLWDNHEEAIQWYQQFMSWQVEQQENWKPDPRCAQGAMTRLNWGTWLVSSLSSVRLPFHHAERGTVDSSIRLCWRTGKLNQMHRYFRENGVRVSDIYPGPGQTNYFDFWATKEGTRLTAQEDKTVQQEGFIPSWIRIGVSNLEQASEWYSRYLGMTLEEVSQKDQYVVMSIKLNHQHNAKSLWVLEKSPDDAYVGKINGPVRPICWVADREQFFNYHSSLADSGIETSEVGGFLTRGLVSFYFYDLDGNRLNVSSI